MGAKKRSALGWRLLRDPRTGNYTVRFTLPDGSRPHRSTGTSDRGEAQKAAARIYAEALSGRRRPVASSAPLEELCAAWLVAHAAGRSGETIKTYELYCEAQFIPFFCSLSGFTEPSCADYGRHRLRQVAASTVRKEVSALRSLVEWLHEQGYLPEPVRVPGIPKRAIGKPDEKRRKVRVELTHAQAEALIKALPTKGREGRPVRDLVTILVETGIRRATLWRLETPKHYHRGARELVITGDIDKARDGRPLPLTEKARKALDRICPDEPGPICGRVSLRHQIAEASKRIGLPEHLAGRVSYHDLRHAFISDLAARGASIAAIQYLAGHGNAATSARYIHPAKSAAEEALALRGRTPRRTPKTKAAPGPKPRSRKSA